MQQHDRVTLVISVSEQDMPGIKPGSLGWQTSALTNELQEVKGQFNSSISYGGGSNSKNRGSPKILGYFRQQSFDFCSKCNIKGWRTSFSFKY